MRLRTKRETRGGPSDGSRTLAPLGDPRFLVALATLLLNDWWWKSRYPSWATGKLSDFAGLVVLPVLLAVCLDAVRPSTSPAFRRSLVMLGVGGWFAAMKTSAAIATTTQALAAAATGRPSIIVVDPTDLIALVSLGAAWRILVSPWPRPSLSRSGQIVVFSVAAFACVATSSLDPYAATDLVVDDEGEVRSTGIEPLRGRDVVTNPFEGDGAQTSVCIEQGERCFHINGTLVEESLAGSPPSPVWAFDWSAPPSAGMIHEDVPGSHRGLLDIVAGPDERVHVLLGGHGTVVRSVDGTWSESFRDFRPIHAQVLLFSFIAIGVAALVGARLEERNRWVLALAGGGVLVSLLLTFAMVPFPFSIAVLLGGPLLVVLVLAVVVSEAIVDACGLPESRLWMLLLPVVALLISLSIAFSEIETSTGESAMITGFFVALIAVLLVRWRKEMVSRRAGVVARAVAGPIVAAVVFTAMLLPQVFWRNTIDADFWWAITVSLGIGCLALVGAALSRVVLPSLPPPIATEFPGNQPPPTR